MGNYIYMNIFKKKFQKIQKPLDASLFCVYLLKVPTFTRGNFYTLEMQLLWLTKSSQDSFLHMRPILYNVERGNFIKFWQYCIISGPQDDQKNLKMGKYGYFGNP